LGDEFHQRHRAQGATGSIEVEEGDKFSSLCAHYKDTYDLHRETLKQRDRLFYGVLFVFAAFTLQFVGSPVIVPGIIEKVIGVRLENDAGFFSTLLWLALLGWSTRYFQITVEIQGQYYYMHRVEDDLNSFYQGSIAFTREGITYLATYSWFQKWIRFLFTWIFPIGLIGVVSTRSVVETCRHLPNWEIDLIPAAIIFITTLLYLVRLHWDEDLGRRRRWLRRRRPGGSRPARVQVEDT